MRNRSMHPSLKCVELWVRLENYSSSKALFKFFQRFLVISYKKRKLVLIIWVNPWIFWELQVNVLLLKFKSSKLINNCISSYNIIIKNRIKPRFIGKNIALSYKTSAVVSKVASLFSLFKHCFIIHSAAKINIHVNIAVFPCSQTMMEK